MKGSLRVVLTYTIAFYIYQRVFKAHKLNMKILNLETLR
jgi:hypothetical protein